MNNLIYEQFLLHHIIIYAIYGRDALAPTIIYCIVSTTTTYYYDVVAVGVGRPIIRVSTKPLAWEKNYD